MLRRLLGGVALATLTVSASTAAFAGAFELRENSAAAQGLSHASSTSGQHDVMSAFSNPAALRVVGHAQSAGTVSGLFVRADGEITDSSASVVSSTFLPAGAPVPSPFPVGDVVTAGVNGVVGGSAFGYRINEDLVVGLTIASPFGLETEFEATDLPFAAEGISSHLLTVTANPTIAYDILPTLTIGGAVSIMYARAELTNSPLALTGAEDFALGFNLGVLWDATENTRFGFSYRSGYDLELEGDYLLTPAGSAGLALAGASVPAGVTGEGTGSAELPAVLNAGVAHRLTDSTTVYGEFQYAFWNVFDTIDIDFTTGALTDLDTAEVLNYENSFFIAGGVEYEYVDKLKLRFGVAFDETPTTDADRTVRIPDGNRVWIGTGLGYEVFDGMTLDLAYNFISTVQPSSVEVDLVTPSAAVGGVVATETDSEFIGRVHIVTVGGSIDF